ncbi:hypothetical protein PRIPAC_79291 [Pristionchus pacificus]|nr:hypothetical protein PRIPAC_79291 [Pristionchus pacificus]
MIRIISLVALLAVVVSAKLEQVSAKGRLMCGDKPFAGAEIRLTDKTGWNTKMSSVKSDKNGYFELTGTNNHWIRGVDAKISIIHRCNNKKFGVPKPCKRMTTSTIPSSYVTAVGATPKPYNIGTMNLEAKTKGEESKCWPF